MTWAARGIPAPFIVRRLGDAVQLAVPVKEVGADDGTDSTAGREDGETHYEVPRRASIVLLSPALCCPMGKRP